MKGRRRPGLWGWVLLAAVVLLVGALLLRPRSEESRVREVVEDFLRACREGDRTALRALTADGPPGPEAEPPTGPVDGDAPGPLPAWPRAMLEDLAIERILVGPVPPVFVTRRQSMDAEARLRFGRTRYGDLEPCGVRVLLVREDSGYRIAFTEAPLVRHLPAGEPPPRTETVAGPAGPVLVVRIGFGAGPFSPGDLATLLAPGDAPPDLELHVREDLSYGELAPFLEAVAGAGRSRFDIAAWRVRPCFTAWLVQSIGPRPLVIESFAEGESARIRVEVPPAAPARAEVLRVEPVARREREPGEFPGFRWRIERRAEEAVGPAAQAAPALIDAAPAATVWRMAALWDSIWSAPRDRAFLALPGPGPAADRILRLPPR